MKSKTYRIKDYLYCMKTNYLSNRYLIVEDLAFIIWLMITPKLTNRSPFLAV